MNTDVVVGVSDSSSDALNLLFNDRRRPRLSGGAAQDRSRASCRQLDDIGLSGIANIVAAIKLAKHFDLGADDVVMTVATDSAALYGSERESYLGAPLSATASTRSTPARSSAQHLDGIADDHVIELTHVDRKRIFNLGYYTWVEQQGVSVEDFDRRKDQRFWTRARRQSIPAWDRLIDGVQRRDRAAR